MSYDEAREVRLLYEGGQSISSIARSKGVNPTTISRIVRDEGYMRTDQYDRKSE